MFWGLTKHVQHTRLKAQLVGISFPRIYNPNEAELKFNLTNNSGRDYELPSKVKVLEQSSDGILDAAESTAQIGFPTLLFSPTDHTVTFDIWVPLGSVLDHAPATDQDVALLKQKFDYQFKNTTSFVVFDEKQRVELVLPVR